MTASELLNEFRPVHNGRNYQGILKKQYKRFLRIPWKLLLKKAILGPILRIWVSHLQQKKTCKNRAWQQTIGHLIIYLLDMKLIIKNLLNLSQNIVLTCRSGRRVLVADKILKRKGYLNLRIYSGSFKDWVKNRGTVIKDSQEDLDYFWMELE